MARRPGGHIAACRMAQRDLALQALDRAPSRIVAIVGGDSTWHGKSLLPLWWFGTRRKERQTQRAHFVGASPSYTLAASGTNAC